MRNHALLFCVALLVSLSSACCGTKPASNPQPITDFQTYVGVACYNWLAPRMDQESWEIFKTELAGWKYTNSFDVFHRWFEANLGDLWNTRRFVAMLRASELYASANVTDDVLLAMIQVEFLKFEYKPEQE